MAYAQLTQAKARHIERKREKRKRIKVNKRKLKQKKHITFQNNYNHKIKH
jgi:hypothetical protein